MAKCKGCDGTGRWLLMNSWFYTDGFRREGCHTCQGSGVNPPGYAGWPEAIKAQRRFVALVKEWGGRLKPPVGWKPLA